MENENNKTGTTQTPVIGYGEDMDKFIEEAKAEGRKRGFSEEEINEKIIEYLTGGIHIPK